MLRVFLLTLLQVNRSKLDRVTAAAHERHKASFNPQLHDVQDADLSSTRLKRRVSMGSVIDAETGEAVEGSKRHSRRTHTMLNTSETAIRVKDAEVKKASRVLPSFKLLADMLHSLRFPRRRRHL